MLRRILTSTLIASLLMPQISWAGTFVKGDCYSGEIATTAELFGVQRAIVNETQLAAENIARVILKTSAQEQKLIEYNTTAIVTAIREKAVLEKANKIREELTGPTAQPSNICDQPEMAAAMQNGRVAERQVAQQVGKVMQERAGNVKDPVEAQRRLNENWAQNVDAQTLFKSTMTEAELTDSTKLAAALTNPFPLSEKLSKDLDEAERHRADAIRNLDMMRRSLGTTIFQDIIAWRSPTNQNGELLTAMAKAAGAKTTPPGIVNGKASMAAYWDFVILSRTGSPNWYSELATRSSAALLREQTMIQAQLLEMQIRNYDLLQKMAGLLANMQSVALDEDRIRNGYRK